MPLTQLRIAADGMGHPLLGLVFHLGTLFGDCLTEHQEVCVHGDSKHGQADFEPLHKPTKQLFRQLNFAQQHTTQNGDRPTVPADLSPHTHSQAQT